MIPRRNALAGIGMLLVTPLIGCDNSRQPEAEPAGNVAEVQPRMATTAGCSPIVDRTAGNVAITLNCSFGAEPDDSFNVSLVRATLACNSDEEPAMLRETEWNPEVRPAAEFFAALRKLDDQFVYFDLAIPVGGRGCGIADVAVKPETARWGALLQLDEALDGFPGNPDAYEYGYQIDYGKMQGDVPRYYAETLLLPSRDRDSAFLRATYMSSFRVEGLARVRVNDVQGHHLIELLPATPVGSLATHYSRLKQEVERLQGSR